MRVSALATGLRCLRCGTLHAFDPEARLCSTCAGAEEVTDPAVLDVTYDYTAAATRIEEARAVHGVFRFAPLLPADAPSGPQLHAGGTPLTAAPRLAWRLGLSELWIKDETRNPTRCLKDRATSVAIAMARTAGATALCCASAGNAAISLAGFCANAGLDCHVYVPRGVAPQRLEWLRAFGAHVTVADGDYDVAYDQAERDAAANGWYSRNCAINPFLVEGKKTAALEIAEAIGAPDLVVSPVGDGCTLGALGKGFREARTMGWTSSLPRLVGVQGDRIRPLVDRWEGLAPRTMPDDDAPPRAASMAVRRPRNALRLLEELRHSEGAMLAVSDVDIIAAQRRLAAEAGVVAEHTSAATLAGLERLAERESLARKVAVLVITGGRVDQ